MYERRRYFKVFDGEKEEDLCERNVYKIVIKIDNFFFFKGNYICKKITQYADPLKTFKLVSGRFILRNM
jgi:hypothetical protein